MRILVVHCAYQYKGGEDTVVEEEMTLLQKAGHEVKLLRFQNEGNTWLKVLQLPFNFSAFKKTKKAIREYAPDVLHIHNLHFAASPSVLYAGKKCNVPFVCTLHNYRLLCPSAILFHKGKAFLDSLEQNFPWKAVKVGVYKNSRLLSFWMALSMQLHRWLGTWQMPARYIVLSAHANKIFMDSSLRLAEGQVIVKPNFCSDPGQKRLQRDGFLFVGRLSEEKGVRMLLHLFASSPYQLIIAGDGPLKDELQAMADKTKNITYVGSLKKHELFNLMQRCSALIFPSIWYEGMPLTIIEAFANGLPVIATKLGAMEYMVTPENDGLLFEAGNEKELAAVLEQWEGLSHAEKEAYSKNARTTYQSFYTPEKNVEQLIAIYHSVQKQKKQTLLAVAG